ncbi:hypothetical protein MN116_008770 [Schistosoma mekongi]|uniref:Uncharacterized protein n=1 Tax=Schistosoma mekongi TaxID=38744 RepID=A0AAE1Z6N1_SCHME|nr:hypothetical protein MN116_008770 [Schistosoma mekongi]
MKMMLMFLFYINLFLILINESIQNDLLDSLAIDITKHSTALSKLIDNINKELASENRTIDAYVTCFSKQWKGQHGGEVIQVMNDLIKSETTFRNKMKVENTKNKCNALATPHVKGFRKLKNLIARIEIQISTFNFYLVDLYAVSDILSQIENKTRTLATKY